MRNLKNRILLSALALTSAFWALGPEAQAGRGSSYAEVMSAIRSDNADVIISELERAERLICGACVEPVMDLLDHDDYRVREVAAWWFARRPAQKTEIFDRSVARLYADDATLARNAADALGTFRHPNALPALTYALGRTDLAAEVRVAAVHAIGTIGHPSGEPAVVTALADGDATVRIAAMEAYERLRGVRDGAPVATLLTDSDAGVRRAAAKVVGQYRTPAARAALEGLLASDPDATTRRYAAWSLGEIGDRASRVALETAAAGDASSLVRSVAKSSIAKLR